MDDLPRPGRVFIKNKLTQQRKTKMPTAQIPGADDAIREAAKTGWEAVAVVVILLCSVIALSIIGRWVLSMVQRDKEAALSREERLAVRITGLEDFIHTTLLELVKDCRDTMAATMRAIDGLTKALSDKPCLMNDGHQSELTDRIAERVAEKIHGDKQ